MAEKQTSPVVKDSEDSSSDRDSDVPSLNVAGSSASPDSAEDKPQQQQEGDKKATDDGSATSDDGPPRNQHRQQGRRRRWESLPVEITVRDSREFRRNDLPPRFRNRQQPHHNSNANFSPDFGAGPSTQQVPEVPPIPLPIAPYRQEGALPAPVCHPDNPAQRLSFNGTVPRTGPTYHPRPVPVPFTDARQSRLFYIRRQVEHYFKPHLLARDTFMLNNMDSEGFVPISLIANFRKVKELTKEFDLLVEAIKSSEVLEVRDEKVRRKNWTRPSGVVVYQAQQQVFTYQQSLDTNGHLGAAAASFDFRQVLPSGMDFSVPPPSVPHHFHAVYNNQASSVFYPPGVFYNPYTGYNYVSSVYYEYNRVENACDPTAAGGLPDPPSPSHQ